MVNAATKTRGSILTREQTYSSKYVVWMCALLFALIMGRAVSDIFLPVFAVVGVLVFAFSSVKHCIPLLLFLFCLAYLYFHQPLAALPGMKQYLLLLL